MTDEIPITAERRRFLKLVGGAAVLSSVVGLTACGGEEQAPAPDAESTPQPERAPEKPAEAASPGAQASESEAQRGAQGEATASDADLPKHDENSPQAKGLAYTHDAGTVNAAQQSRYKEGQDCGNCALYQGGDAQWGRCALFPGKLVNRDGWCSGYSRKAG